MSARNFNAKAQRRKGATGKSPWVMMNFGAYRREVLDPVQQLALLKRFDAQKLREVIKSPDTSKVARVAATARLALLPSQTHGREALPLP